MKFCRRRLKKEKKNKKKLIIFVTSKRITRGGQKYLTWSAVYQNAFYSVHKTCLQFQFQGLLDGPPEEAPFSVRCNENSLVNHFYF